MSPLLLALDPNLGPYIRVQAGFASINCVPWQKLYWTQVVECPCFIDGGSHFQTLNLDLEESESHVILETWSIIFRRSLLDKSSSAPSTQYLTGTHIDLLCLFSDPDLWLGDQNGIQAGSAASWEYLIKHKMHSTHFSGGISHIQIHNLNTKGSGPHILLELQSIIFTQNLKKQKS